VKISVVIPAYNEEERIGATVLRIKDYLEKKGYEYEIIVVDDGSNDKTAEVVARFLPRSQGGLPQIQLLQNKGNKGKGFSVKRGVLNSKGDYILFSDADLSTPIEELDKLLEYIKSGFDIAIGSRGLKESDVQIHQAWHRERMGKIFNLLVRIFVLRGIKDTQCGFKCFSRGVAYKLFPKQLLEGFGFDVEILYLARKKGYSIKEVPVKWYNSPQTRVNALRDSIRMFMELVKIRINDWKGKYQDNFSRKAS
jgi:dolichyl-phosphate beta-glucosyltransferase